MGKWVHILSDINVETRTATCAHCGPVSVKQNGENGWRCTIAAKKWKRGNEASYQKRRRAQYKRWAEKNPEIATRLRVRVDRTYRDHLKPACERCNFEPEDACQLDVHHLDGDKTNNDPANLRTLCANCHRLTHVFARRKAPLASSMTA